MSTDELQRNEFGAKVALELNRYDDMIGYVKNIAALSPNLDHDQRILFSTAFHEAVSQRRSDITILQHCLEVTEDKATKKKIGEYIAKTQSEIHNVCLDAIDVTDRLLLPASESKITDLFYNKLKADYYRYDAENQTGHERELLIDNAELAYRQAIQIAQEFISPGHPIFLGLILNYCVFTADLKGHQEDSHQLALDAIAAAEESIEDDPSTKSDSEICIRLLRDNCELWAA